QIATGQLAIGSALARDDPPVAARAGAGAEIALGNRPGAQRRARVVAAPRRHGNARPYSEQIRRGLRELGHRLPGAPAERRPQLSWHQSSRRTSFMTLRAGIVMSDPSTPVSRSRTKSLGALS